MERHLSAERMQCDFDCCTVISRNYLPQATAMIRSYRRHHSGGRFFVLLVDEPSRGGDPGGEPFEIVRVEALGIPEVGAMRMRYDVANFCAAVRPPLMRHLIDRGSKKLVYLDPDLYFTGPMRELDTLLNTYRIILTLQTMAPFPADQIYPQECFTLGAGVFNSGFVAVSQGSSTDAFLFWWGKRLKKYCFRRPDKYMFGDQKWLDFVPFFFGDTHVITDPSYNVAFWNLHERPLERRADIFSARGEPVTFFHMSEFKAGSPPTFTRYQPMYAVESVVGQLSALYQRELEHAGYDEKRSTTYAFDFFDNGVRISPIIRKIYEEMADADRLFPDPFVTKGDSFLHRLLQPVTVPRNGGYLMRLHLEIGRLNMEASLRFPSPDTVRQEEFALWLLSRPQRTAYALDPVFLLSLRPLVKRIFSLKMHEFFGSMLLRRHAFRPYQLLCNIARRMLGKHRFEQLKPKVSAFDGADPYTKQRMMM